MALRKNFTKMKIQVSQSGFRWAEQRGFCPVFIPRYCQLCGLELKQDEQSKLFRLKTYVKGQVSMLHHNCIGGAEEKWGPGVMGDVYAGL